MLAAHTPQRTAIVNTIFADAVKPRQGSGWQVAEGPPGGGEWVSKHAGSMQRDENGQRRRVAPAVLAPVPVQRQRHRRNPSVSQYAIAVQQRGLQTVHEGLVHNRHSGLTPRRRMLEFLAG